MILFYIFIYIYKNIVTIKCIWGQKMCFFERYTNINRIDDKNLDLYQKVLTYEVDRMVS